MDKTFVTALQKRLSDPKKIVILPHKNPDGDALGSTLALLHFLETKAHEVVVLSPNDYPNFLKWLPGEEKIVKYNTKTLLCDQKINDADLIFTLDFNALSRVEEMEGVVQKAKAEKIMIDHHEQPDSYAALQYSDPAMSSTCEMVYHLINALDPQAFSKAIATCLYTGIMTDTGSFRYPSTTPTTHKVIAHLLELGAQGSTIHEKIYDSSSFNRIKLLGLTLSNLKKIEGLPVAFMTLTRDELQSCDYKKGDTEGFVNYGLSIEGVIFSCIMIENDDQEKIKMSFRSQGDFSVNAFARTYFEGGGHHNAAGGMSLDSLAKTVERFITAVKKEFQQ